MSKSRRAPAAPAGTVATRLVTVLAATARDIRRAVAAIALGRPLGVAQLRDTGWHLTQLTGELTDLAALLAEHTGHHTQHPEQVRGSEGEPATEHLARASRDLAALRQALDAAHTAARDYYSGLSHLHPTPPPTP